MTAMNRHLLKINEKRFKELNIKKWHEKGITGKNIRIAVIGETYQAHHAGRWLIEQTAPDAEVIALDTTMASDRISWEQALEYCLDNDVDVVSLSYKKFNFSNECIDLSKKLHDKACILLCASHNDGGEIQHYPVILDSWYAVGTFNGKGRADYSNWGRRLLCLGYSNYANKNKHGDYIPISHTSGTPQVIAGMTALLKQVKPNLTVKEFEQFVANNSIRLSTDNWNKYEGWGLFSFPGEIPQQNMYSRNMINILEKIKSFLFY